MKSSSARTRQWIAASVSSISVIILGTALGWPSPILLRIKETGQPMNLTSQEISWMVSLLYLGNLASPLPAGYLMDRIGRKTSMLVLAAFPLSSWVIVYFATTAWHLHIARFLAGTWSGTVSTVVPMYLAEISQPRIRGALSTLIQLMTNFGVVLEYLIGPVVSYGALAIFTGSIPLLFIILFATMPESPYWLLSKNRTAAAGRSLAWLRGYPSSDSASVTDELDRLEESVREDMRNVRSYRDLFATPGNRKGLLIVQMLALIQRMSGISALMAYTSTTLPQRDVGFLSVNDCVLVMGGIWVVSVFIATYLVDKLGRKPLLLISCLGCTLAMFSAGLWFYLDSKTTIDVSNCHWIPFASFVVYGIFFCFGLGPIASTVQGEYFPQSIKGLASGVTSLVLAATSFVMNKIYHSIALTWGMHLNYFIFAGASLVGAIFVVTVVIETKGKTFQEIQEKLNSGARRPEARYSKAPVQEL
ncbi:facilitated trehalose transporter Tret1-like [Nesidiocoris tenuis]|uniref:Facilitated trehalose transporter Tret1-like n=1 Tax=Nesidiocoris tenuis TaxID=355587 RepID=A0ABN7BI75_9HEMI|nr:facilitated trehalose transporter Tret1-like [Nesidiocoris tenuis]